MPIYEVRLCYSCYVEIEDIQARDEAEAIEKAEAIVNDVPFPFSTAPSDMERWKEADMVSEVECATPSQL